eukprot:gene16759-22217_t
MRQLIARVSGRKLQMQTAESGTGQVVQFRASASMIEWVGVMPARPGVGGRHHVRLGVEKAASGQAQLVLRFVPWLPEAGNAPDWRRSDSRVLVHQLTQFNVQAEGRPPAGTPLQSWPRGWVEGWPVADQLPERVRLQITDADGPWPPTVISIFPLLQGSGSGGVSVPRGLALVAVLWIVAALSLAATGLIHSAKLEIRKAARHRAVVEATALGDAANRLVLQEITARATPVNRSERFQVEFSGRAIRVRVQSLNGLVDINN